MTSKWSEHGSVLWGSLCCDDFIDKDKLVEYMRMVGTISSTLSLSLEREREQEAYCES